MSGRQLETQGLQGGVAAGSGVFAAKSSLVGAALCPLVRTTRRCLYLTPETTALQSACETGSDLDNAQALDSA